MQTKDLTSIRLKLLANENLYVKMNRGEISPLKEKKDFFANCVISTIGGEECFFVSVKYLMPLLEEESKQKESFKETCIKELDKFYRANPDAYRVYSCEFTDQFDYPTRRMSGEVSNPEEYFRKHTAYYAEDPVKALADDLIQNGCHCYLEPSVMYKRINEIEDDNDWERLVSLLEAKNYMIRYSNEEDCYSIC